MSVTMSNYPAEFKDAMIHKMTSPGAQSATSLGKEVGVAQSTLSRWLRERGSVAGTGGEMREGKAQVWNAEQKLEALLEYERLNEEERGKFLRGKGLHEAHLARWKKEFIEGLKLKPFVGGKNDPQRKRIAALEKELRRKEAALAEAAALLVLKKRADAIWGEHGEEK
jgi:transposase-like protein